MILLAFLNPSIGPVFVSAGLWARVIATASDVDGPEARSSTAIGRMIPVSSPLRVNPAVLFMLVAQPIPVPVPPTLRNTATEAARMCADIAVGTRDSGQGKLTVPGSNSSARRKADGR